VPGLCRPIEPLSIPGRPRKYGLFSRPGKPPLGHEGGGSSRPPSEGEEDTVAPAALEATAYGAAVQEAWRIMQ